jgi:S1-C subfamily serine protease
MVKRSVFLLGLLLLAALPVSLAANFGYKSDLDQLRTATYYVKVGADGNCSAVLVAPGRLLTAGHCVAENPARITVTGRYGAVTEAVSWKLIYGEPDLAEIRAPGLACPCAPPLPDTPAVADDEVVVIGHPYGIRPSVATRGEVQGRVMVSGEPYLLVTAPVAPGSSGGGAYVKRNGGWYLIGITSKTTALGGLTLLNEVTK